MPETPEELRAEIGRRNWRVTRPTDPCFICGGNEWRYASSQIILGNLYIAHTCAVCPTASMGGPLIGPVQPERVPDA